MHSTTPPTKIGFYKHLKILLFKYRAKKIWAAIFILSFAVRLTIYIWGGYHRILGDESIYWRFSRGILEGRLNTLHFLPAWPIIIAAILKINASIVAVRLFTILLSSISSVFLFIIGQRHFGFKCGLTAAALHILSPEQVFFSHYLYAETGLEFILLLLTMVCFFHEGKMKSLLPNKYFSLYWGVATLYKHFVIIGYLAYVGSLIFHKLVKSRDLIIILFLYATPLIAYSLANHMAGRRTAYLLQAPLLSMRIWELNRIQMHGGHKTIPTIIKDKINMIKSQKLFFIHRSLKNIRHLWSPSNSYVISRIRNHSYSINFPRRKFVKGVILFQTGFIILGLIGVFIAQKSVFRTYSILSVCLLSSLAVAFFMVSRYRIPFMFHFMIFTSYALGQFSDFIFKQMKKTSLRQPYQPSPN